MKITKDILVVDTDFLRQHRTKLLQDDEGYKSLMGRESYYTDLRKYDRDLIIWIYYMNLSKLQSLVPCRDGYHIAEQLKHLLNLQISKRSSCGQVWVLATVLFFLSYFEWEGFSADTNCQDTMPKRISGHMTDVTSKFT